MEIFVSYTPMFNLKLDIETVKLLRRMSAGHYDRECKKASDCGGLLHKWTNQSNFDVLCTATFRELDLTLKIAENKHQLNVDESKRIDDYVAVVTSSLLAENERTVSS